MGGFSVFTDTQFIGADELGAVSSYQPCHLFGDPMLIGVGIRLSFYLLYFAAIIAVLFGVDKQFRFWHGSWASIALATLIALCLESTQPSGNPLIVVDWAILIQLVLWYPVFFTFLVFNQQCLGIARGRQHEKSHDEMRARLAAARQQAVTDREIARTRAYIDVLKAFAAHAVAIQAEEDYLSAQNELARSMRIYVEHWHEQERIEIVDGSSRRVEEIDTDGGIISTVYSRDAIAEVAAAPTRADVNLFRDNYIAALVNAEHSVGNARAVEREAALIFAEEVQIKQRGMKPKHAIRHLLFGAVAKDKIAAALGLLVWAAYMLVTPWLFKDGYRHGSKTECDANVKLMFVLAPISPLTNSGFRTFLLIFSAGAVVVAVLAIAVALFVVLASLFAPRRRRPGRKGKTSAEADDNLVSQDVHDTSNSAHRSRRQHADEILVCLHTAPAQQRHRHQHQATAGRPIHFSMSNIPWAILLTVLVVETIVTVELTVRLDNLDFVLAPLHETAEILATIIGLLAVLLVLWSVVSGFLASRAHKRDTAVTVRHGNDEPDRDRVQRRGGQEAIWPEPRIYKRETEGQGGPGVAI
jgi:hypothetical protein